MRCTDKINKPLNDVYKTASGLTASLSMWRSEEIMAELHVSFINIFIKYCR
jgi:hypothetical protein